MSVGAVNGFVRVIKWCVWVGARLDWGLAFEGLRFYVVWLCGVWRRLVLCVWWVSVDDWGVVCFTANGEWGGIRNLLGRKVGSGRYCLVAIVGR